ncbi:DNA-binding protein [Asaia sp. HumB]|uniref:DNA-binding protein n=1 Tax=Asaia sp. HumB TaxID=3035475 RepID=UPI002556FA82|nr:DNA-binding protein [Asaia sp. HumB]MDL2172022.1 DNA-binding protein [Asaia sp. HumB]
MSKASFADWPRYMTREVAARYLGVSVDVFDYERSAGWWPPPRIRGQRGGRLTWDRKLLDSYADRDSALVVGAPMAVDAPVSAESGPSPLAEKMNATLAQNRPQRGAQASQRRHHH